MIIHKEGKGTLGLVFIILVAINVLIQKMVENQATEVLTLVVSVIFF